MLGARNYLDFINVYPGYKAMFKNISYWNKGSIKLKEEVGLIDVDFDEFTDREVEDFYDSDLYSFLSNLNIAL